MINLQGPSINGPLQSIEIDKAILDLQIKFDTKLSWLSHNYARAYRNKKTTNGKGMYYPEIYTGKHNNQYLYHRATPDNDETGKCFFIVGKEKYGNFNEREYQYVKHDLGIVFNANLSKINDVLHTTEDFTQHLIRDVREVLTRCLVGTFYKITIDDVVREFDEIYKEFTMNELEGYLQFPQTGFRFNCEIEYREDCIPNSLSIGEALQQNISKSEIANYLLPTLDFSEDDVFNSLTIEQVNELTLRLCP